MDSWFKVERSIFSNEVIVRDAEHFAVWIYLLGHMAFKGQQVVFGAKPIYLHPGQLLTSRRRIADELHISESKVQRILKMFENAQLIEQQTGTKNRVITVKECSFAAESEQQTEPQVNHNRTTSERQVNTYKNEKKYKKERRNNICSGETKNQGSPTYDLEAFARKSIGLKYHKSSDGG